MKTFAILIREARLSLGKTQADVFFDLKIDAAILSKIERGERTATKRQVFDFIAYFKLDEKEAFSLWLSDKILKEYKNEAYVLDAFKVAEQRVIYNTVSTNVSNSLKDLLAEADSLKQQWEAKKPLDKTQMRKMREYFNVNYTYDSNRIEGSTLTMQETHLVVNEGLTVSGKSMQEHLEAVNHHEAIDFITGLVQRKEPITERVLNEINYLILNGIDRKNAGKYRTVPVLISGSSHKPPQPFLVGKQMEDVFGYYAHAKANTHTILLAADMHEKVVTVHPYVDGNGRTSRLFMNLILLANGYTIANIKGDRASRLSYYRALEDAQTNGSKEAFYRLVIQTSIDSLKAHIEMT